MTTAGGDNPGVVAPPPLIYIAAIVGGALLERVWRARLPTGGVGSVVGLLLLVAAVLLASAALREFKRAQTSPKPYEPTSAIVTGGPFRFTRNPIYISFTLTQLGVALIARSGRMLALLVPVLVVMRYGVIAREESYLAAKFGDEYRQYRERVRRWV